MSLGVTLDLRAREFRALAHHLFDSVKEVTFRRNLSPGPDRKHASLLVRLSGDQSLG